ncbi:MAG: hypothetical protein AB8B81_14325 [Halioglobus sp.]
MASIFEAGNSDPMKLNSSELLRYRLLMSNITEVMLEIYTQAFTTKFAPETWDRQGRSLVIRVLSVPGCLWFWAQYQDNYPAHFRAVVDQILLEHSRSYHSI